LQKEKWNSKFHTNYTVNTTQHYSRQKEIIINYFEHKCNFPGGCEWNIINSEMLHIHHKNGNGGKHRKEIGGNRSNNTYNQYLALCPNCHEKIER